MSRRLIGFLGACLSMTMSEHEFQDIAFENIATSIEGDAEIESKLDEQPYYDLSDRNMITSVFADEVDKAASGEANHNITRIKHGLARVTFADYQRVLDRIDWEKQTAPEANRKGLEQHGPTFVFEFTTTE